MSWFADLFVAGVLLGFLVCAAVVVVVFVVGVPYMAWTTWAARKRRRRLVAASEMPREFPVERPLPAFRQFPPKWEPERGHARRTA